MKNLCVLYSILFTIFCTQLQAKTYFIASGGSDLNTGSINSPFLTIGKAAGAANAGDTIYIRGGNYLITTPVSLTKSGTSVSKMQLWSYPGERAILDFSGTASGKVGITLSGSYWHIKGISVKLARDNGMRITGSGAAYNIIEFCEFYDNMDSGLQLDAGANNNKIINCDSYYNADPTDYGDADGFAVKMAVGNYNYFYGCRSWLNVDDGWDGYLRGTDNVYTTIENCWTWKNGYFKNGTDAGVNANGNGFKMGGSDDKTLMHNMVVKNCLAFENKSKGFDQNNNKGNMTLYNCTGYNNVGNNFSVPSALNSGKTCTVVNCAELGNKINMGTFVTQTTNSWQSPFISTTADFQSTLSSEVTAPRQADGSLPLISYMHLANSSDLIDGGTDIGLPFNGTKPDLGAWETGNYNLYITNLGKGMVALNPAGGNYKPGTLVTLTAIAFTGNNFSGFSGDITELMPTTQITINSDLQITANFSESTGIYLLSKEFNNKLICSPSVIKDEVEISFTFPLNDKADVTIINSSGQMVYNETFVVSYLGENTRKKLNLSHLKAGVYLCVVSGSSQKISCKLIKL